MHSLPAVQLLLSSLLSSLCRSVASTRHAQKEVSSKLPNLQRHSEGRVEVVGPLLQGRVAAEAPWSPPAAAAAAAGAAADPCPPPAPRSAAAAAAFAEQHTGSAAPAHREAEASPRSC